MRYTLYRTLFILLLGGEILLTTAARARFLGLRENGIALIVIAAVMGLLAMLAAFEPDKPRIVSEQKAWEQWLLRFFPLFGLVVCAFYFHREISRIPIDVHISDIIPTIQVLDQRLLSGSYPYAVITSFGYELHPTYLPMMWLPFLPAALFHFDERWIAFAIWSVAVLLMVRASQKEAISKGAQWLLTVLPFFLFMIISRTTLATYGNTIELMIVGFYLLFALQLAKIQQYLSGNPVKNGAMMAFFICLCLLSRYSFLLWLPLAFGLLWLQNRKFASMTAVWVVTGVLVLFVLPFMSQDPMIYINGLKHYSSAALTVWEEPVSNAHPLYQGLGIASIFKDAWEGEMSQGLAALQQWQVAVSLAAVGFCALLWGIKGARIQHFSLYLVGSLKFYFAFFYGFIQMPYLYLMLTPCFLSIVVLLIWYQNRLERG